MIVSGQYPTMVEKELCTYPLVDVLETKVMSPFPVSKTRRPPTCILRQHGVLFTAYVDSLMVSLVTMVCYGKCEECMVSF